MSPQSVEVLLVEDNPSDAELVLVTLGTSASYRIYHVHDGEEALDFLFCRGDYAERHAGFLPRLLLLDLKLPKVNGLEVLREVRADPRTRSIPVVLLTSSKMERDVAEGYRLGVNSYIQKPVDFEEFRETVKDIGRYWLERNEPPPPPAVEPERI